LSQKTNVLSQNKGKTFRRNTLYVILSVEISRSSFTKTWNQSNIMPARTGNRFSWYIQRKYIFGAWYW